MQNIQRSISVDILRGLAVFLMVAFHFCYDLSHYGFADFDFYHDPFWLNFRIFIVCLFLLVSGISLRLASNNNVSGKHINKRLFILFGCALLITISSWFIFPGRTIWFGIIHLILFTSLIGMLFVRRPYLALILGLTIIWAGNFIQFSLFNQPLLHWIGLMTHKPATEDYAPLFPWLGVVFLGIYIAFLLEQTTLGMRFLSASVNIPLRRSLIFAGRHSLLIYMIHQPILFSAVGAIRQMLPATS